MSALRPIWLLCAGAVALAAPGCGDGESFTGEDVTHTGGNNIAILSGTDIGSGATADSSRLRKRLRVDVLGGAETLSVGDGYALRSTPTVEQAFGVVIPVTNTGDTAACFIQGDDWVYRDDAGDALTEPGLTFVFGSVGDVGTLWTSSCLAAGETGVLTDFVLLEDSTVYTLAASVEMRFEQRAGGITRPGATVRSTAYEVRDDGTFVLNVENQGDRAATVQAASVVALDASNQPVWHWLMLLLEADRETLAPGASMELTRIALGYSGSAERIEARIDFEAAGDGASDVP